MVLLGSAILFLILTGMLYLLGVNVWVAPKAVIDRVSGENWQGQQTAHPSLMFRDMLEKLGSLVPASPKDAGMVQKRLIRAGFRTPMAMKMFFGFKAGFLIVLPLVAFVLCLKFDVGGQNQLATLVMAAGLGYFGPNQALLTMVKRRQKHIKKALPNALDLMVVCVESGLGLDQAMMQVAKELGSAHPEISSEFAIVNLEMRHGKRRADALRNLADRTGVDDLRKLTAVLLQADRFGTSIGQSLRHHSEYIRTMARQDAETRAAKIGVKLVFPIFFCILPALFVVTVGPVVVRIMRDLIPLMTNL